MTFKEFRSLGTIRIESGMENTKVLLHIILLTFKPFTSFHILFVNFDRYL